MKLMVIDGNSIINRSFYGIRPLSTRDGLFTHAVYGFVTTMQRLLDEEQPEALCVTFDRREPTFRHTADENYKATRRAMPEELAMQIPVLKQVLDAMDIPRYELVGWEADDLIGTISRKCERAGWDCVAVTGDKDSLQLITDHTKVKLVSTRMGQTTTKDMTPETFREAYGFDPIHMIDLKALMGDTSDNILGVPGVGEKTAMALVQAYSSIDEIYRRLPDINAKPAAIRKLTEGEESARHSYWLATIVTDVPLDFAPEENLRRPFKPELYDLFLKLEFSKLIEKYGLKRAVQREEKPDCTATAEIVTEQTRAEELLQLWRQAKAVTVYGLGDLSALVVQCETEGDTCLAAELYADRYGGDWHALLTALFSADIRKVGHNIKDMMGAALVQALPTEGFVFDTALAAYLADATAGSYDLPRLFVTYFNEELPGPAHLEPDAFAPLGDRAAAQTALLSYTAAVAALHPVLEKRLREMDMTELYETVELPLCAVLARMERRGFLVDGKALAAFGRDMAGKITELEQRIYDQAGETFNINSTQQLGRVLFEVLGLPSGKKTKTGYSTSAEVLDKLRGQHPIIENILEYRQLTKLKSTYADGLGKVIAPDGRIHTSFQNTVTATGRLSSTNPNLQNIPVRTELGAQLRKMFVAPAGKVLVDADYSQIELRLLACMARDRAMIDGFNHGEDVHTITASQVFGVPVEEVTPLMRRSAKAVNFGIVYGISAFSLSQDIGVTVAQAKEYMEKYFQHYSGVKAYMDHVVEQARQDGYVTTLFGRRRWVPELKSSNFNTRSFGERVALNAPIQGTAADIIKLAMIRVRDRLRAEGLEGRLVLQVHDELIVECPERETERVCALVKEEMEAVAAQRLPVRLLADTAAGKTWAEAH